MGQDNDGTDLVIAVAEDFVGRFGSDVMLYLEHEESLAANRGDSLSAEAWHDIATAATVILGRVA